MFCEKSIDLSYEDRSWLEGHHVRQTSQLIENEIMDYVKYIKLLLMKELG